MATGGLGTYEYQWFQSNTNSNAGGTAISGATSSSYLPLTDAVGTIYYYVLLIQSGLDCEVMSDVAEVVVVPSPTIDNQPQSADYCEGDSIASLTVTLTNGTGTPSYQWFENTQATTTGGTAIAGANGASFDPPSIRDSLYYYVEVNYTGGGCSLVVSEVATIMIDQAPTIADESIVVCSGELFNFTPDNTGTNIFDAATDYSWSLPVIAPAGSVTGASASSISQSSVEQQLINTTSSVAIATYIVTPNSGGCVGDPFQLEVQVFPKPEVIFSEVDQVICDRSTSTVVNLSSNFSTNIEFEWTATIPVGITGAVGAGTDQIPAQTLFNSTTSPLTVTYFAKAIFLNGSSSCEGEIKEYKITVQPSINAAGVVSDYNGYGVSSSGAADGSIDLTVSGGSGSYTFQWTGPGGYTATAEDISGLVAGNYQLTISDGFCAPVILDFTLTSPPELLLMEDISARRDLRCFGDANGALTVLITQGSTDPYDYELLDENGVVIATVINTSSLREEFTGLIAGSYSVRITDAKGASKTITDLFISQPDQILIAATKTPISCYLANDASIRIAVSGGTAPYTASWSNLANGFFQDNLSAGDYIITVTDDNSCTEEIKVTIEEVPVFFTEATFSNISCNGANDGSIQLNLTGGVAPVTLTWSDGSTQGTTRNNLGPGTYTAIISDGTPCTIEESFTIIEPQEVTLDASITNVLSCDDTNTGAINLSVSGGTAPFTYSWSNGATTEDLTGIPPANYQVIVTDSNGCGTSAQFEVIGTKAIVLSLVDRIDTDCNEGTSSQILTAQISGGVAPYSVQWSSGTSSGVNNQTLTTDQNGLVILTVTDALGCERTLTFDVNLQEVGTPSFDSDSIGYSTYGSYSIQDPIQFTDTSTGTPTEISWDFGDGSFSNEVNPVHVYATAGQYAVIQSVTYDNGCVATYIVTLEITKGYKLVMPNAFTPNGDNINDVFRPSQEGLEELQFSVYDSWGSLIYSEEGEVIAGWDGTMNDRNTENGNFYYKFTGKTFYGKEIATEGTFTKID
jgi:gliding motility-associated-like protein